MMKFTVARNLLERALEYVSSFSKKATLGTELVVGVFELNQALTLPLGTAILLMAGIGLLIMLLRKLLLSLIARPVIRPHVTLRRARPFSVRGLPARKSGHRSLRSASGRRSQRLMAPPASATSALGRVI